VLSIVSVLLALIAVMFVSPPVVSLYRRRAAARRVATAGVAADPPTSKLGKILEWPAKIVGGVAAASGAYVWARGQRVSSRSAVVTISAVVTMLVLYIVVHHRRGSAGRERVRLHRVGVGGALVSVTMALVAAGNSKPCEVLRPRTEPPLPRHRQVSGGVRRANSAIVKKHKSPPRLVPIPTIHPTHPRSRGHTAGPTAGSEPMAGCVAKRAD
jgi:hypothetical protein